MQQVYDLIEAWNSKDAQVRRAKLEPVLTPNFEYTDPHVPETLPNIEAMLEFLTTFHSRIEHHLELIGAIDAHHHVFRFDWRLRHPVTNDVRSSGTFIGMLEGERIRRLIGFLNRP